MEKFSTEIENMFYIKFVLNSHTLTQPCQIWIIIHLVKYQRNNSPTPIIYVILCWEMNIK